MIRTVSGRRRHSEGRTDVVFLTSIAHDTDEGVGGLDCLPDALKGTRFYEPTSRGMEAKIGERLLELERLRREAKQKR